MAKSMNDQSSLFDLTTCEGSPSVTSSPASEAGATPCGSQGGPMIAASGLEVAPVSRGAWRAVAKVRTIPAIFGQRGSASSGSHALQASLENRLRAATGFTGSMVCSLTWNHSTTPSGRRICRLLASGAFIEGIGSGLLPTPNAVDYKGSARQADGNAGEWKNLRDWFRGSYNFLYPPANIVRWLMGYPDGWVNCAAYGNAIVPQVAQVFIEAYMSTL